MYTYCLSSFSKNLSPQGSHVVFEWCSMVVDASTSLRILDPMSGPERSKCSATSPSAQDERSELGCRRPKPWKSNGIMGIHWAYSDIHQVLCAACQHLIGISLRHIPVTPETHPVQQEAAKSQNHQEPTVEEAGPPVLLMWSKQERRGPGDYLQACQ